MDSLSQFPHLKNGHSTTHPPGCREDHPAKCPTQSRSLANPAVAKTRRTVTLRADRGTLDSTPLFFPEEGCHHEAAGVVQKRLAEGGLCCSTQALCQVSHGSRGLHGSHPPTACSTLPPHPPDAQGWCRGRPAWPGGEERRKGRSGVGPTLREVTRAVNPA